MENVIRLPAPPYSMPLGESPLQLIGAVCVVWAQLELISELGLATARNEPLGAKRREITGKLKDLRAFAETGVTHRPTRAAIVKACTRGIDLAEKRNLAIHGKWARSADPTLPPTAVSWFNLQPGLPVATFTALELPQLYREICEVAESLKAALIAGALYPFQEGALPPAGDAPPA